MKTQAPASSSIRRYKQFMIAQKTIGKMVKRNSFRTARQLIPVKLLQESVDHLGLDKFSKKINLINLFKAAFFSVTVKNSSFSRSIASVGKRRQGLLFSQLPEVSHVSVIKRLQTYDEDKTDAILSQLCRGLQGLNSETQWNGERVRIIDGSTFSLSYSRTGDELPKISQSEKGLMKLGLVISAGSCIPIDWQFSTDYDDNQIFRDLVDWSLKGWTYLIDRGNVAVDYLKQFTDNRMYFIQKTLEGHTFDKLWAKPLPKVTKGN